jgi:hypothetical protein
MELYLIAVDDCDDCDIEADLTRLGATPKEAAGLAAILQVEGWGEERGQPNDAYLMRELAWYRDRHR